MRICSSQYQKEGFGDGRKVVPEAIRIRWKQTERSLGSQVPGQLGRPSPSCFIPQRFSKKTLGPPLPPPFSRTNALIIGSCSSLAGTMARLERVEVPWLWWCAYGYRWLVVAAVALAGSLFIAVFGCRVPHQVHGSGRQMGPPANARGHAALEPLAAWRIGWSVRSRFWVMAPGLVGCSPNSFWPPLAKTGSPGCTR